jgi:hypothetical protein
VDTAAGCDDHRHRRHVPQRRRTPTLAARFIAVANRHRHGWRVHLADGSVLHTVTFDAAADAVSAATGVPRLLIHWPAPT